MVGWSKFDVIYGCFVPLINGFLWAFVIIFDFQILNKLLDRSVNPDVVNRYKQVTIIFLMFKVNVESPSLFDLSNLCIGLLIVNGEDAAYVGCNAWEDSLCEKTP